MTNQQFADVLLHHWQNLWPLPPAERMARIEEIRLDYNYERVLSDVAVEMQSGDPEPEVIAPEPSNLLQFMAAALFVGCCIGGLIIAATPVPV
jgi:hypothetical protein